MKIVINAVVILFLLYGSLKIDGLFPILVFGLIAQLWEWLQGFSSPRPSASSDVRLKTER